MPTVLLSYRHKTERNPGHMEQVREFAERLRKHSTEVILDQIANEEQFNRGGPPEGWERWSYDQVDIADKVLIIAARNTSRCMRTKKVQVPCRGCN